MVILLIYLWKETDCLIQELIVKWRCDEIINFIFKGIYFKNNFVYY
jgi:hypothetical protein